MGDASSGRISVSERRFKLLRGGVKIRLDGDGILKISFSSTDDKSGGGSGPIPESDPSLRSSPSPSVVDCCSIDVQLLNDSSISHELLGSSDFSHPKITY